MIKLDQKTEIVHVIHLDKIKSPLESIKSDLIDVDYTLSFYWSKGPLRFTDKILDIGITFTKIPHNYKELSRDVLAKTYNVLVEKMMP